MALCLQSNFLCKFNEFFGAKLRVVNLTKTSIGVTTSTASVTPAPKPAKNVWLIPHTIYIIMFEKTGKLT
jgi:hypothetical protein